ncbi:DUF1176 domain-containing protein [Sphingomonas koreensis]|nr:DUF1176 domain-containing protein [Sphingomonas koreensis]
MHRLIAPAALVALAACSAQSDGNNTTAATATPSMATTPIVTSTDAPVASPVAAATPPKPGDLKIFGDWIVGCDNTLHCTMASLGEGADFPKVNLALERAAGPVGAITLTLQPNDVGNGPPPVPASLAIDSKPVAGRFAAGDQPTLTGTDATAIATAMADAQTLTIRNATGAAVGTLSLKGASAALRYIDAQQGRVGKQTAIVARGAQPASNVPAGPVTPQIVAVVPIGPPATPSSSLVAKMTTQAGCDDAGPGGALQSFAMGGAATLVLVPCGSGAYNVSSALFVMRGDEVAPAQIDAPSGFTESDAIQPVPQVVNGDFEKGVLTSYAKGRGLGDCGVEQQFVWDGARLRLSEQSAMGDCRGNPNFITLWRAKVARR